MTLLMTLSGSAALMGQDASSSLSKPPDSLRVAQNACPFECCQYGTWIARNEITVYASERDTSHIVTTIPSDQSFKATGGNVFMERYGEVDVVNPFALQAERNPHKPGDTLFLLDYLGEGFYRVWTGRTVVEDGDFFVLPEDTSGIDLEHIRGVLRVSPIQRWWARIRLEGGAEGWIDMDQARVDGADACG